MDTLKIQILEADKEELAAFYEEKIKASEEMTNRYRVILSQLKPEKSQLKFFDGEGQHSHTMRTTISLPWNSEVFSCLEERYLLTGGEAAEMLIEKHGIDRSNKELVGFIRGKCAAVLSTICTRQDGKLKRYKETEKGDFIYGYTELFDTSTNLPRPEYLAERERAKMEKHIESAANTLIGITNGNNKASPVTAMA